MSSGELLEKLHRALLAAFPSPTDLERMVTFKLNQNLNEIASPGDNLTTRTFRLIEWADASGKLNDLVLGAREHNPMNPTLREFAKKYFSPSQDAASRQVEVAPEPARHHDGHHPDESGKEHRDLDRDAGDRVIIATSLSDMPRALREAINQGKVLPVVGPLISRAAIRSNGKRLVPTLDGFLTAAAQRLAEERQEATAKRVYAELKGARYEEAIATARSGFLGALWEDFLEDQLDPERAGIVGPSLAAARAVWHYSDSLLVTTNHDDILRWVRPDARYRLPDRPKAPSKRPVVWHLCGHVHDMMEMRLRPKGGWDERALASFRTQAAGKTLLFVGFTRDDPFFAENVKYIIKSAGGVGPHYAIVSSADAAIGEKLQGLPVQVVAVPDVIHFLTSGNTSAFPAPDGEDRVHLKEGAELDYGRYKLVRQIGAGGFATVWEAHDTEEKDRSVAIKILREDGRAEHDQKRRRRFFRGAKAMSQLGYTSIVNVLEHHKEDGGHCYFVMDLIKGCDLEEAMDKGILKAEDVIPIILRIGEALAYAHDRGFVHRDVKPSNILLRTKLDDLAPGVDGEEAPGGVTELVPLLTDFDLVLVEEGRTRSSVTSQGGTVNYMAPEVLMGEAGDATADEYSLAKTTVRCMDPGVFRALELNRTVPGVKEAIAKLRCRNATKEVLKRALSLEKKNRYPHMTEFCDALRRAENSWQLGRPLLVIGVIVLIVCTVAYAKDHARPVVREVFAPAVSVMVPIVPSSAIIGVTTATITAPPPPPPPPPPPLLSCPEGMVLIQGGNFRMGSDKGYPDEKPTLDITVPAFCIDRTEVTAANYQSCIDRKDKKKCAYMDMNLDGRCTYGWHLGVNHPINCVRWSEANKYCKSLEKRLPKEQEWEYAAKGKDGRRYPWGEAYPYATIQLNACDETCRKNGASARVMVDGGNDNFTYTAPVGSFPLGASPFGVLDMAGNVAEWTDSFYCPYAVNSAGEPDQGCGNKWRVVRGGSWSSGDESEVTTSRRKPFDPTYSNNMIGFRCAMAPTSGHKP